MKKNKLASFLLTAVILLCANGLYFDRLIKVTFFTDVPQWNAVRVSYTADGKTQNVRNVIKGGGRGTLRIYAENLAAVKFDLPDGKKMTSLKIEGRQKISPAIPSDYDVRDLAVQGRVHFDLKFFLLFAFMTYGMVYTLFSKKKLYDVSVPKLKNVEFLRLLFTFCIVAHHMTPVVDFFNEGWLGVEFFFILSGFFLMITFNSERTGGEFVRSKIAHFIPLTVLAAVFNGKFALIPANMLFLQGTGLAAAVPPQGWYLGVLFWVTLFYFYILKTFRPEISKLIIAVLTFLAYGAFKNNWSNALISFQMIRGIAGIGLGYFLGCLWKSENAKGEYQGKTMPYTIAEMLILPYSIGLMFVKPLYPDNKIFAVISFAALIVLFVLKRGAVSRFFEKSVLAKISCCSFAIYMTHENLVRNIAFGIMDKYPAIANDFKGVLVFSTLLLSYGLGVLVWKYAEAPAARWLKSKMN